MSESSTKAPKYLSGPFLVLVGWSGMCLSAAQIPGFTGIGMFWVWFFGISVAALATGAAVLMGVTE